jgi:hypothetical protein
MTRAGNAERNTDTPSPYIRAQGLLVLGARALMEIGCGLPSLSERETARILPKT